MDPGFEPASRGPSRTAGDPVERLLFECLELAAGSGEEAVERMLAAHPEHAERVRSELALLRRSGLVAGADEPFPDRLGEFRLIERIGGGGMGVVYRAIQEPLAREVALKLIRPEHLYFPGSRERFRREVLAVARLSHPGIVPVYCVGEEAGVPYFAMERIDGETLADALRRLRGRDPTTLGSRDLFGSTPLAAEDCATWTETCLSFVRGIAEALEHAHGRGVLHRDVKPSNVAVARDGRGLVFDFGLASVESASAITRSGSQPGSLPYMSPEQLRGERDLDARADVYSLGVVLHEMLTLRQPFERPDQDTASLRERILAGDTPRLDLRAPAVPRDVAIVCSTAMAPERARRYASAADFARDLGNLLQHRPIEARATGPWLRALRWSQRHPTASGVAAVVAVAMLIGGGLAAWQQATHAAALGVERDFARRRFDQMRSTATELLFDVHESIEDLPGSTPARQRIVERALELLASLSDASERDPDIRADIAWARVRLGDVLGDPAGSSLGDPVRARAQYVAALGLIDGLIGPDRGDAELRFQRAYARMKLAVLDEFEGRLDHALEAYDALAAELPTLASEMTPDARPADLLAAVQMEQCNALATAGRFEGALAAGRGALEHWERRGREDPADSSFTVNRIGVHRSLCRAHRFAEDADGEERELDATEALVRELLHADPENSQLTMILDESQGTRAALLFRRGFHDEAIELDRAECASLEARLRADPTNAIFARMLVKARGGLGSHLATSDRLDEGRDELEACVVLARRALTMGWDVKVARDLCIALHHLALVEEVLGHPGRAIAACAELMSRLDSAVVRAPASPELRDASEKLRAWCDEELERLAGAPGSVDRIDELLALLEGERDASEPVEAREAALTTARAVRAMLANLEVGR